MTAPKEFFEQLKIYLNIDLKDQGNDFWTLVASEAFVAQRSFQLLAGSFARVYPKIHSSHPHSEELVDNLFFELVKYAIAKSAIQVWWLDAAREMFAAWTLYGSRDISDDQAHVLGSAMRETLFDGTARAAKVAIRIVFMSPKLWGLLKDELMSDDQVFKQDIGWSKLLHRHAPHLVDFSNIRIGLAYYTMCGYLVDHPPTLLATRNILTGPHNNVQAWYCAISLTDPTEKRIGGSWMKMLETFSSLHLDPKDQNAWKFWHLLCSSTKGSDSGQDLIAALAETQFAMHQAFNERWSAINALADGDERFMLAARQSTSQIDYNPLSLPFSSDAYTV